MDRFWLEKKRLVFKNFYYHLRLFAGVKTRVFALLVINISAAVSAATSKKKQTVKTLSEEEKQKEENTRAD